MAWNYEREEQTFELIPEGTYRIRIKKAEKAVSNNGNDMIVIDFEVSGMKQTLRHWITFMDDHPEITNRNLTQLFDSFSGIAEGDFNLAHWVGKTGACAVAHRKGSDGEVRARVWYFIKADKQDALEPWKEPNSDAIPMEISPDDLPF